MFYRMNYAFSKGLHGKPICCVQQNKSVPQIQNVKLILVVIRILPIVHSLRLSSVQAF